MKETKNKKVDENVKVPTVYDYIVDDDANIVHIAELIWLRQIREMRTGKIFQFAYF